MTGKQRAYLRSLANAVTAGYQVGKNGAGDTLFAEQLSQGLEKNEIIKIHVLENSGADPKEIARGLSEKLGAEVVQVIGSKIVLYRESEKHKTIILP